MKQKFANALSLALIVAMLFTSVALASDVNFAVVDVTLPYNSVTLAPGASTNITINMSVVGKQEGTATFEVYRDWTLSGGVFSGSNPEQFTVPARLDANAPATAFSTTGTVTVASGQANGNFTLAVSAFDITNSNQQGAKLVDGADGLYDVTVFAPPPPSDTTPPVITPNVVGTLGNNGWYVSDVTVSWSVVDNESAISSSSGCDPTTINADTAGTTLTCTATSAGGSSSQSVTIKRDATPPTLSPSVSPNPVVLNGIATASAGASDATSGLASSGCDPVDTGSAGLNSVNCTAADNAGNTSTDSATYTVNYALCVLYDQTKSHKAGSTVPLKLQLCDVNGNNYSSADIIVSTESRSKLDNTASASTEDSGYANPDYNFRYDATLGGTGGYIYNLSTKGLTTGTWKVTFKVDGVSIPSIYFVKFDVK